MVVRKEGSQWCVFSKDGEKIACHPTKEEALEQLRAIEANDKETEMAKEAFRQFLDSGIIDSAQHGSCPPGMTWDPDAGECVDASD